MSNSGYTVAGFARKKMSNSREYMYDHFKKKHFDDELFAKALKALGISEDEFFGTSESSNAVMEPEPKYGRGYLEDRVEQLEKHVMELLKWKEQFATN